jgi:hypothetical protein
MAMGCPGYNGTKKSAFGSGKTASGNMSIFIARPAIKPIRLLGVLPSTSDSQGVAGDVRRLLGGEKQNRIGHLDGLSQTA